MSDAETESPLSVLRHVLVSEILLDGRQSVFKTKYDYRPQSGG